MAKRHPFPVSAPLWLVHLDSAGTRGRIEDSHAGRRQILHPHAFRRPGVIRNDQFKNPVDEPVIERFIAAVAGRHGWLSAAVRRARRTLQAHMNMVGVAVSWPALAQPA